MIYTEKFKQGDKVKVIVAYEAAPLYKFGEFVKYLNPFFTRALITVKETGEIIESSANDLSNDENILGKL